MTKIMQLAGKAIPLKGNDIDTDRIIPARFMRTITFDDLGKYAFYDQRFDEKHKEKPHIMNNPQFKGASIMIVNRNFGCGSSREHAPQSLMRWGIKALIGESFAEIFSGNCQMLGVPCVTMSRENVKLLQDFVERDPEAMLNINLVQKNVNFGDTSLPIELAESSRKSLSGGSWNTLGLLVSSLGKTRKIASKIRYLSNFE